MKIRKNLVCLSVCFALLASIGPVPALRAQTSDPPVENRILLVFDTSSAMKKRLPAQERAINQLFAITLNGRLHRGDTIGVWTFNRDLHIGQFPLQEWSDDKVSMLPDEIAGFLKKQRYTKQTSFDDLLPTLNQVAHNSPRLTIFIFCDGDGTVKDIPGTGVINDSFKQHYHEMEKARVPFVIVLRSQFGRDGIGRYVGCTVNSADSITIPQFPPMFRPPLPAPVAAPAPPPPPMAPPLIIVGTNFETHMPPAVPPPAAPQQHPPQRQPAPAPTLPPPPAPSTPPASASVSPAASPAASIPVTVTNSNSTQPPAAPPPTASIEPTNPPFPPVQTTARSIPPAAPTETSGRGREGVLAAGAGLAIVAVGALFMVLRRSRGRGTPSLITESLKKR